MMRVCPTATCDYPIPCDQNYTEAVKQQEQHAINVFGDLSAYSASSQAINQP